MTTLGYNQNQLTLDDLPELKLESTMGEIHFPQDFIGTITIMAFYPADGSPVCTNQLAVYNQAMGIFRRKGAKLYGISIDDMDSHQKFATKMNLKFPLISDTDPTGRLSKLFGVYSEEKETCDRAIFVLDEEGNIFWSQVYPDHVNPGAEGIMQALDDIEARQ